MIALEVEDERVTRVLDCRYIGHGEFVTDFSIPMQNAGATQNEFHAYLTGKLGVPEKAYQKSVIPVLAEKAPRTFLQ